MLKKHENHSIDFLFPLIIFFIFTVSALAVIVLSANVYESTAKNSSLSDSSQIALSYVSEKIHQNDENGNVKIVEYYGSPAIQIDHSGNLEGYETYIYAYDDGLYEVFASEQAELNLSSGKLITETDDFLMQSAGEHLIELSCKDAQGRTNTTVVALRSGR